MRATETSSTTTVRHVARPLGRARESGPHLGDLRRFVQECAGLPDEVLVRVDREQLDESGRSNVTFSATLRAPLDPEERAERRSTYPFRAPGGAVNSDDGAPATPVLPAMDAGAREFARMVAAAALRRWEELMATEGVPGSRREATDG